MKSWKMIFFRQIQQLLLHPRWVCTTNDLWKVYLRNLLKIAFSLKIKPQGERTSKKTKQERKMSRNQKTQTHPDQNKKGAAEAVDQMDAHFSEIMAKLDQLPFSNSYRHPPPNYRDPRPPPTVPPMTDLKQNEVHVIDVSNVNIIYIVVPRTGTHRLPESHTVTLASTPPTDMPIGSIAWPLQGNPISTFIKKL